MEFTGQLIGGPDDGSLVSSKVEEIEFRVKYGHWLDGPKCIPSVTEVWGVYKWEAQTHTFKWINGGYRSV